MFDRKKHKIFKNNNWGILAHRGILTHWGILAHQRNLLYKYENEILCIPMVYLAVLTCVSEILNHMCATWRLRKIALQMREITPPGKLSLCCTFFTLTSKV